MYEDINLYPLWGLPASSLGPNSRFPLNVQAARGRTLFPAVPSWRRLRANRVPPSRMFIVNFLEKSSFTTLRRVDIIIYRHKYTRRKVRFFYWYIYVFFFFDLINCVIIMISYLTAFCPFAYSVTPRLPYIGIYTVDLA